MGWFSSLRVPSVGAQEAMELVKDGATLLDVREKNEWNAGHAPLAKHLPLSQIDQAPRRVPAGRTVVVVCRSGNRSRQATVALRQLGINALNLSGGMHSWASSGGSVVDRSNRPGRVI
jgi:rhodanese-related sulfurtransferase